MNEEYRKIGIGDLVLEALVELTKDKGYNIYESVDIEKIMIKGIVKKRRFRTDLFYLNIPNPAKKMLKEYAPFFRDIELILGLDKRTRSILEKNRMYCLQGTFGLYINRRKSIKEGNLKDVFVYMGVKNIFPIDDPRGTLSLTDLTDEGNLSLCEEGQLSLCEEGE